MEIEGARLVCSCVFREDDVVECVAHAAGLQLAVLHFVEAVAAKVQAIALLCKVSYQFVCAVNDAGLVCA